MPPKVRLILAAALVVILAAAVIIMNLPDRASSAAAASDAQTLERLRAESVAPAAGPAPIKFEELPAEPPSRARKPTR
jgi:hypothetical protein